MKKTAFEFAKEYLNAVETEQELLDAVQKIPALLAKPERAKRVIRRDRTRGASTVSTFPGSGR
jgi:hypothetical protein